MQTESRALQVVDTIVEKAIGGVPPVLSSPSELAIEYIHNNFYQSNDERVDSLINWETSKSFCSGFITGLGGLITLPITIPAWLLATWVIQARMSAAIAHIYGHNISDDRVKTMVILTLISDSVKDILKELGIKIANNIAKQMIMKIPERIITEINKKVGFILLTKAGEKGLINLIKVVPVIGGVVGGTIDAVACKATGKIAKEAFRN